MILEEIELWRGKIEAIMLQLDPKQTPQQHKIYLAGYVDCLKDTNQISEEQREILYLEYAE
jgi:hypothetical protein